MSEPQISDGETPQKPGRFDTKVPCPFCAHPLSRVVDTISGVIPKRRRECLACHRRYNTREILDHHAA